MSPSVPEMEGMDVSHWGASFFIIVQELCESRGGRPGLSVLTVSVDVKQN